MTDHDDALVCSNCGYDYCVCHLVGFGFMGAKVRYSDLRPEVKKWHLEVVITTMIHARAPQADIDRKRAELDAMP